MSETEVDIVAATTGDLVQRMSLPNGATVKDVKGMLYARLGIYPELQQLLLQDEILDDESTVSGPLQLLRMSPSYGVVKELPGVLEWRFDVREQRELPHVATLANGLAKALGENAHAESNDDMHSYELQLEVIMPESGEVAELIFTEISNGLGEAAAYSCPVDIGSHVMLAVPEASDPSYATLLSEERTWVQVVWPSGPKRQSGYVPGKGQPPYGFISMACLKPLPREKWHTATVLAPRMHRLYS